MSEHDRQHAAGFEALVRPHFERMYRLAFRLTASKPEADDLFQDVLVKVFPRFEELLTLDQPGPWLCRVMYNHLSTTAGDSSGSACLLSVKTNCQARVSRRCRAGPILRSTANVKIT